MDASEEFLKRYPEHWAGSHLWRRVGKPAANDGATDYEMIREYFQVHSG